MGSHSRSSSVYSVSKVMLPVSMAFGRLDYQPLLRKRARASPPKRRRAGRHLVTGVFWLTLDTRMAGRLRRFAIIVDLNNKYAKLFSVKVMKY